MNMGSAELITGVAELAGGNQSPRCADLIAAYPWSDTAIGAQVDWPEALKVAVALMLGTVSPVAIMVGRATTLLYNDAYAQIAGSRHPAALGSRATDSWPEIAEFNMRVIETCLAGNGLSFRDEHLVLHRNGEPEDVWLDIDYTPLRTGDGTPIGAYATLVETTGKVRALRERLAAQEVLAAERAAIEDANERLRVAQDSGGIGTFEWFPATGLLQVSDRFCELWGLAPRAELNTAELVPLVHPDDRHRLASLRPVGDTNPLEYSEFRVALPATGETRWLARRGEVVDSPGTGRRYFGVVFDITTRKRIEEDQKFLLHLTDRLQFARDAQDVTHSLAADLATLLGVSGMGYASIDVDLRIVVDASQRHGAIEKLLASSGLSLLTSSTVGRLVDGHAIAINDACGDLQLRPEGQALADAGVRTLLLAPLLDEERLSALLYVYGTTARNWSASELGLIKEVAERVRWANESKRSQAALGESESQFRSLVEAVPHQVWIAEPDGQLTWFNNRVYEYTGAAEGSLDGDGWASVVHPDDLPAAAGLWAAALRDGTVYETEFRLRQGGSEKWRWFLARAVPVHDNQGGIVRWLGTNTDVHAQRTAAAELASMNAALEQRVEERTRDRERMWRLSTDLMLVADGDGRIGTVNPAWLMLLGWPNDQVSQRRLIDFAHADDRSQLELAMAPLGARGGVARFEGRFMHIDGSFRWIAWTAVSDGQHMHAAGRDITANKTASIALAQAEEALRQAQKMEAVGQLTGGIAHDFNNLLQGITGSLDLIRTRIAQDRHEDVARFVTSAMASANRATALTHRLLAFSRRQPLSPKVVRLNDLAVSLEELIRRTIGEGVELTFALSDNLWPTLCDPNQMESSLLNLVINARDAMPDGGRLTIKTENVDCTLPLPTGSRELKPGRYVCLRVSDTGMGMPPDVIERAFDPFFTTKPIGQGTGLGLSMIYGFAQQSEGAVHIESAVGAGTTVSIYLPKCDASEVPMSAEPGPAEPSHRAAGGAVVLVIEDEPIVRALVLDVLQEMGYQTIEAADGPSGLQLLQSRQRVDLLVTDIGLPGLNGRQVADAARLTRPDLKVLFMTGYAENAAYARGFLEAGMSMITKPFTLDTLELTVQEIMTAKVA